jgi:hypothetical protein
MIAEFIDPHDARWKTFLQGTRHDCYHLPEYVELAAAQDAARPMAFYAEEGPAACLIPLLVRSLPAVLSAPADWFDCVSPYGYPGILLSPSQERLPSFLEAFHCTARASGMVSAFLRLHPLFSLDHGALGKFGQLTRHGQTVLMNLGEPEERIWQRISTKHKPNIRKLSRLGFRVTIDEWERLPDFIAVYHSTMRRVSAGTSYYFSAEYFETLRAKLGTRVHLACVLDEAQDLAAAGLFIATEGIVQYHLSGTAERYVALAPSKLMLDFMWRWAKAQAQDVLHFGGGVGGAEDTLFRFKAGFSPGRGEFHTYRVLVDESKHAALNHAATLVRGTDVPASPDFFPAYRSLQACTT